MIKKKIAIKEDHSYPYFAWFVYGVLSAIDKDDPEQCLLAIKVLINEIENPKVY